MPEFDLIDLLARGAATPRADVAHGIGDDAAVLEIARGEQLVACVDTLVAGVHFPRDTRPADLGWKSLAVNLSDLAAMGAAPRFALLTMTLPTDDRVFVRAFAAGFQALARRHGVALVGGDTTRGPLSLTVQALGEVPPRRALARSAARPGDGIWVSGTLGDAAAGLAIVQRRLRGVPTAAARRLRARLDRPQPRVALGLALRGVAGACIDVSDGLAQDLGHVLRESGVGALVDVDALPLSAALRRAVADPAARRGFALSGGDDYELCFTVPARREARLPVLATTLRLPLTRIGTVVAGSGLALRDSGGRRVALSRAGHDHFA